MGNKRFELSGQLLSPLFEHQFKLMNDEFLKKYDAHSRKPKLGSDLTFHDRIDTRIITLGLERCLYTGNWAGSMMRGAGMTQVVSRLSFIGLLSHMTKIVAQYGKSRKVGGPSSRALHPSQWGMLCPCDTPEGEACGLMKNLALLTRFTTDAEEHPITSLCYNLGVEDLELLSPEELHMPSSYLIILNGLILGKHRRPQKFANNMRKLRRNGRIGEFVSIFVNEKQGCVYIASDGGRVCRPLIIADKGVSRIREDHKNDLRDGVRDFDSFIREGLIEYLDVNEENNLLISLREDSTPETTHIEIDPSTILGVCAGLIPYPHHNPSPGNIYQCAMGKQAMGNIGYNQLSRMDKVINLLVYSQRPLLTTRTIELVGYDKLGAGQNSVVAVMSYDGYDINDAIVMNKASLDRGFGRCIVKKTYSDIIENREAVKTAESDDLVAPQRQGPEAKIMQILDDHGLALPGEIIRPRDIFINKKVPDVCIFRSRRAYKGLEGEPSVVERVALYNGNMSNLCIKVMIRHTRRPEIGDKFSSRHGQKGVCGNIIQQEDLPFSESGISPDLIINPHGFPGKTVGKLIELLGSKAAALGGRFLHGTAFGEPSGHADTVEAISETLVTRGFSYCGKDFLYSGTKGSPLEAYIFMGPIYYQKLKQMVQDKMKGFPPARHNMLTRQPIGGLRVGEMERDCLIAYGASMLTYERLMLSSDPCDVQVCQKCGLMGYYNYKLNVGICSMCKNAKNIATVQMPYACKLLIQELQSMNIIPRLKLEED